MRVLFSGDRRWRDRWMVWGALASLPPGSTIIEGEAPGLDTFSKDGAALGHRILPFPAQWARYGRAAGPIRNRQMLVEGQPDYVWAFHDDLAHSKGTADMVRQARKAGVKVRLFKHVPMAAGAGVMARGSHSPDSVARLLPELSGKGGNGE